MRHPLLALALLTLCLPASAARADGPNLLTNPGLAKDLTGWITFAGDKWTRTDWKGNPNSGSAKLVQSSTTAGLTYAQLVQCIAVTAGQYLVRGRLWVTGGTGDKASLAVVFKSGASCSGSTTGSVSSPNTSAKAWTQVAGLGSAPAGTQSAYFVVELSRLGAAPSGNLTVYADDLYVGKGTCAPGAAQLCLVGGRFAVTASLAASSGTYPGQSLPFNDTGGSFWFTSAQLVDLDVRVLNGCAVNGAYWVQAGGLVGEGALTLTVTDTKTGTTRTYANATGTTFPVTSDTLAFATCP